MSKDFSKINATFPIWKYRFLSKRTILLGILLLVLMNIYLSPIKAFSIAAGCKVSPWAYPYLITDANFLMIFMSGVIYFYSNVPFAQGYNSYSLLRQGRKKWLLTQIKYIFVSAYSITIGSVLLSWLAILSRITFNSDWGKVLFTISKTNAGAQYGLFWDISAQYMSKYTVVEAMIMSLVIVGLGISFLGILMFCISIYFSRMWSVLIVSILVLYSSVVANVAYVMKKQLSMFSPVSWMKVAQINVNLYGNRLVPKLEYIVCAFIILIVILSIFTYFRIGNIDFVWNNEEE